MKLINTLAFYTGFIGINLIMIVELQRIYNPIFYMLIICLIGGIFSIIYYHIMDDIMKDYDIKVILKKYR